MGSSRWSPSDWAAHTQNVAAQPRQQIFIQRGIHQDLNPRNIKMRESCDSSANPNSTPIILACDETGSMGVLAETIIKRGLGTIMEEIYERKPVSDPHIMCMGVGDAFADRAPLQVTQFEASIVLADQLKNIYLEGNGGGNGGESYLLAWYFAAFKTKCDSQIKRKKKGYIFTIGDEAPHQELTAAQIEQFIGDAAERSYTAQELLEALRPNWEVFHLIVKPVYDQPVVSSWKKLLDERAIQVLDHEMLGEVIVSTIQVIEGHDPAHVVASWTGGKSLVVQEAVKGLTEAGNQGTGGVQRFT